MSKFRVTQIEKRRRGPFGLVVATLFYGFNLAMLLMIVLTWVGVGGVAGEGYDDASIAAVAAIGFFSTVALFWFWILGAIILGLIMYFTRGKKVILTRD